MPSMAKRWDFTVQKKWVKCADLKGLDRLDVEEKP